MVKAAAAAITGDISLHESPPAFKVSAGVREEGAGEARQVGEGDKARMWETSSQESARVLI